MDERVGQDHDDSFTADVVFDDDGAPVIRVVGEVDLATAELVRSVVVDAIKTDPARVVFDLSGVGFMDSSGISVLLEAIKLATSVQIRRPSEAVRRVIEVTGLTEVLQIEP